MKELKLLACGYTRVLPRVGDKAVRDVEQITVARRLVDAAGLNRRHAAASPLVGEEVGTNDCDVRQDLQGES